MIGPLALVLAVACSGSPGPSSAARPSTRATCEVDFRAPQGFVATERFEDPYSDHVGLRVGFEDRNGRELHYFAGIPGEFGEGLPAHGFVTVATGQQGRLLGGTDTWVLAWETTGPCAAHAVFGLGFTREGFLRVLEVSGVVSG